MKQEKWIKIILAIRIALAAGAIGATIYWIYWSFELYDLGYLDEHVYATALRPIFGRGLLISVICSVLGLILRAISDRIKRKYRL